MKRKRILTAALLVVFLAIAISGYFVFDYSFPFARPITYPSIDDVTAISIYCEDKHSVIFSHDFAEIITSIGNSKPTRRMSINDTPAVSPHYRVEVQTGDPTFNYYIFEEPNKVYIERPYDGIYIAERKILEIFSDFM